MAAEHAPAPMLGVLSGGFRASALREAGVVAVFSSVGDLGGELAASVRRAG